MEDDCLFVEQNDLCDIKIYYKKVNKKCQALTESEFKALSKSSDIEKNKSGFKESDYKELVLKMRELTWGLYNELQEFATETSEGGDRIFNYRKYKENKFERLLVSWDAKDKNGSNAAISPSMIRRLPPEIPEAALKAYDTISVMDKDAEKN